MSQSNQSEPTEVSCEVCLKEIPRDEAQASETEEYVAYFCGLDCYELWKNRQQESDQDAS